MNRVLSSIQPFQKDNSLCRVLVMIGLLLFLSISGNALAGQSDSKGQEAATETEQTSEYAEARLKKLIPTTRRRQLSQYRLAGNSLIGMKMKSHRKKHVHPVMTITSIRES